MSEIVAYNEGRFLKCHSEDKKLKAVYISKLILNKGNDFDEPVCYFKQTFFVFWYL